MGCRNDKFCGDATNALGKIVTIATQQRKLLDEFKTEIEAMRAQKEELSKLNIPQIENIARPRSSYAQSLKSTKLKNAISDRKNQFSFRGIIDDNDDLNPDKKR
uniref:Uncharacterized protein n=1 Tax=Romanomermis culicivorax TaxID=13658 RepID=A0A915JXP6_ROMCU